MSRCSTCRTRVKVLTSDEARAALGATATSGDLYGWILENKAGSPGVDADKWHHLRSAG